MGSKRLSDKEIADFLAEIERDNKLLVEKKLSEKEYWSRVHARDAKLRKMHPEDRRRING